MKKHTKRFTFHVSRSMLHERGFTLIELLIVIAIIGILAGVVMVSSQGAVLKAKKASALTSAASALPELVTCADDDGFGIITVAPTTAVFICCKTAASSVGACDTLDTDNASGHTVTWPNISTTGWTFSAPTGTLAAGTYAYTLTRTGGTGSGNDLIQCSLSSNGCI